MGESVKELLIPLGLGIALILALGAGIIALGTAANRSQCEEFARETGRPTRYFSGACRNPDGTLVDPVRSETVVPVPIVVPVK